jgi:hypothetical protein
MEAIKVVLVIIVAAAVMWMRWSREAGSRNNSTTISRKF